MKKWIFIGGGALVVIIVLVVIGLSNLGPIIKKTVNTYGPEMTKTEVRLGDVDVSIFSAEIEIKDFFLGNPKGFKAPQAINVSSVYVNVDESSLTGDTIIIDRIEVVRPEFTYERKSGTDNFQTILNNIERTIGGGEPSKKQAEKAEKKDKGKKIIIKDFIVKDGRVNLSMSALGGGSISASLPDIHLKDIGKKKRGASPAEAFKEIFAALHEKITSPAVTDTLNKGLKALGSSIESVESTAKKGVKDVTDKVKELFGK